MSPDRNAARAAWQALHAAGGIVTQAEIAERLDVSRAYVSKITQRTDFPDPVTTVGARPVWLWADVRAWRTTTRTPGRPRSRGARSAGEL